MLCDDFVDFRLLLTDAAPQFRADFALLPAFLAHDRYALLRFFLGPHYAAQSELELARSFLKLVCVSHLAFFYDKL